MIISHKYKYIFLKTSKTAGTSIEIALSRFCGPHDIITPISRVDEDYRKQIGYPGARNFLSECKGQKPDEQAGSESQETRCFRFHNHISAHKVRAQIEPQIWDSYFKFCFTRNPWDRVISLYYWMFPSAPRPSISAFIHSDEPLRLKRRGVDLYTINEQVVVDRVCRYEALEVEMESLRILLGIPEKLTLPHAKSNTRRDKRSYREIIDDGDRQRIAELFADEIELFDYQF